MPSKLKKLGDAYHLAFVVQENDIYPSTIHEIKSVEHQSADVISNAVEKIKLLEK